MCLLFFLLLSIIVISCRLSLACSRNVSLSPSLLVFLSLDEQQPLNIIEMDEVVIEGEYHSSPDDDERIEVGLKETGRDALKKHVLFTTLFLREVLLSFLSPLSLFSSHFQSLCLSLGILFLTLISVYATLCSSCLIYLHSQGKQSTSYPSTVHIETDLDDRHQEKRRTNCSETETGMLYINKLLCSWRHF